MQVTNQLENMKPRHLQFRRFHLPACLTALALLASHATSATPIVGDTVNTNLTVTGWGGFANGVDLGQNGELLLNWLPADAANPLGTAASDIALAQGAFLWRDSITPAPAARNKMKLDASNTLTLYRSDGTAGLLLDPEHSKLTVFAAGTKGGIFFGNTTTPALRAAADGSAIFPSLVTLQGGLLLTNGSLQVNSTTPARSIPSGALAVAGGIAGGLDAYFNGVRIGRGAGSVSTNTVCGTGALGVNTSGSYNTASGTDALYANTTGSYNAASGTCALYSNTAGCYNTAVGHYSLYSNTTGNFNVASGYTALRSNTSGCFNTAAGTYTLYSTTTGSSNSAFGLYSLSSNTTGCANNAFGLLALYANTTGSGNTALGHYAYEYSTIGSDNIALGTYAACYQANGSTPLTNSQGCIYIGAYVKGKDNTDLNSIVIGAKSVGDGPNTTVIGHSATTKTHLYGELVAASATVGGFPVLTTKGPNSSLANSATLALGNSSCATQQGAIAIGQYSQATMASALALGDGAYSCGNHATAIQGGYAMGESSFASNWASAGGDFSLAMAMGQAGGFASVAIGGLELSTCQSNCALGVGSVALGGCYNLATGAGAYALGNKLTSSSAYCFAVGSQNLSASNSITPVGATGWLEESALLEVGNGNPNAATFETSNAITTLKNGQTTLTNKAWKANPSAPLADPDPTTDSGGNALVVEGHTVLKGKVVIEQVQGDISMGIYGDN